MRSDVYPGQLCVAALKALKIAHEKDGEIVQVRCSNIDDVAHFLRATSVKVDENYPLTNDGGPCLPQTVVDKVVLFCTDHNIVAYAIGWALVRL